MNGEVLSKTYPAWIASWSKTPPVEVPMWQFGGETNAIRTNKVAGVTCDQNYCYVDYPTIIKENGLNNYPVPEIEINYQSYFSKWGLEISSKGTSYSGDSIHPISGIRAKSNFGKIYIQSRLLNTKNFLSKTSAYVKDGMEGTGYSGQLNNAIDGFKVFVEGIDPNRVEYRGGWGGSRGKWGRWIKASESNTTYAGTPGVCLDRIQIRVVK